MSIQNELNTRGLNPIFGGELEGLIVEKYRGFKGGAHLALFAHNDEGELCTAVIFEQKFDGKKPQCNLIEGMRNGPDLKTDFSTVAGQLTGNRMLDSPIMRGDLERQGVPLTDRDTACKECLEEVGLDLQAMGVEIKESGYRYSNGREHLNILGKPENFVLQNVSFFYVALPRDVGLPELTPESENTQVVWVRLKDMTKNEDGTIALHGVDMTGTLDVIQSGALMHAANCYVMAELDKAYEQTFFDPKKCCAVFPENACDIDAWLKNENSRAADLKTALVVSMLPKQRTP